jgi:hypothetical protein
MNMMLQKMFSSSKKIVTVEADGNPREIPVNESDYINLRVSLKGIRDGIIFNV